MYHLYKDGIDLLFIVNVETGIATQFPNSGPVMDVALNDRAGTNAHLGEFSPDMLKFAFIFAGSPNGINDLRVWDLTSNVTTGIISSEAGGGISGPSWSADSKKIVFIRKSRNDQFWSVSMINADGTKVNMPDIRTNMTGGEQYRGGVTWSKLGLLAFAANTTGGSNIFVMGTDGSGLVNLTNNSADNSTPMFSPDGKQIAFTSTRDGISQIYVMNADGSGLRRVSDKTFPDFSPTWSPDGTWLAFASTRENSTDVYIMDLRGGNVKRITTGGGDHPVWSR